MEREGNTSPVVVVPSASPQPSAAGSVLGPRDPVFHAGGKTMGDIVNSKIVLSGDLGIDPAADARLLGAALEYVPGRHEASLVSRTRSERA